MRLPYILLTLALLTALAFSAPDDYDAANFAGKTIDVMHPVKENAQDGTHKASEKVFVGSTKSNKYHYPGCQWAEKIKPENEIWFSSSQDARNHGYIPCKVCKPP